MTLLPLRAVALIAAVGLLLSVAEAWLECCR